MKYYYKRGVKYPVHASCKPEINWQFKAKKQSGKIAIGKRKNNWQAASGKRKTANGKQKTNGQLAIGKHKTANLKRKTANQLAIGKRQT